MLLLLALVAAVVLGGLLALVATPAAGLALALLLLVAGVVAQRADDGPRRAIGVVLLLSLLVGGSYGTLLAIDVVDAVTSTDGTPEPADPALLGSAEDKLAALPSDGAFRLELTEPELQAVVQEGIAANPDLPVRRVELDLRGASGDLAFTATFKSGGVTADGTAAVTAAGGGIDVEIGDLRVAGLAVPGVARDAIRQLLGAVTDLNAALAGQGAAVDAVEVGEDVLVVTGRRGGATTAPLTGADVLGAIRAQATRPADAVVAPPETLGPGTVDGREASGSPIVLALGDSLAAAVGVDRMADGYVSRFHRAAAERDGVAYGLRNLGQSGETTASLLAGGQLAAAEEVLAATPAAYVTLDVGANDLLGQLQAPPCAEDLTAPACQQRIDAVVAAYERDLAAILDRLVPAADGAQVVLLQIYNPFSLGLGGGSAQEAASDDAVRRLNQAAAAVAAPRGVVVADGFTPMAGTTAVTTGMLAATPDIHPNALGHDVLATALFTATG